jgi:hypothetical protein
MRKLTGLALVASLFIAGSVQAQELLVNPNLDATVQQEIVPGFFLPWPASWTGEGSRVITGPYNDFMSSEPWSGPAPTPVTTGGVNSDDWGVFFKPFSGNTTTNGAATGHLYQDVAATPGARYTFSGWAGGEANFMGRAELALEFIDVNGLVIAGEGQTLDLVAAGLLTDNGLAFDYKKYTVSAVAPAAAIGVRGRVSMLDAIANPAGGGQAFVVDDFSLVVPEPTSLATLALGGLVLRRRRA